MTPKIQLTCGPTSDPVNFSFQLSCVQRRIGVLVSGGLDSAILYYLIKLLANESYTVKPYTIVRNDGSDIHSQNVIDYVHDTLKLPAVNTNFIEISEPDSNLQVTAGLKNILTLNNNIIYLGLIQTLPEHAIGVRRFTVPNDTLIIKYPFKNFNKSHIVDLVTKLNQNDLFKITHSCVYKEYRCGVCNRCMERDWAFKKLNLVDPGIG